MAFEKGNKLSPGGKKGNRGGRPLDEFKDTCKSLANSPAMLRWLQDIVDGKIIVENEVRLKAWDRLCDRGYGKPVQSVMPVDDEGKYTPYSMTVKIENGKTPNA